MRTVALKGGIAMPVLGLGTSQLKGGVGVEAVKTALDVGYRHIDTAEYYGNHEAVGEGIKNSNVPREEIFLTTKLPPRSLAHEDVLESVSRYLDELQTDYVDLLLIHWPNKNIPIQETLEAMHECKNRGLARTLGVSNFTKNHLKDTFNTGIDVEVNQVEAHPTFNQQELREFCGEHDIVITAYAPLGRGADLELPLLTELARKYNATVPQVILNWVLARGMTTIPKSKSPERLKENFDALDLTIEETDLLRIDELPQGERIFEPASAEFDY